MSDGSVGFLVSEGERNESIKIECASEWQGKDITASACENSSW